MPHNEKDLTDVNSGPPTAESTGEQAAELSRRFGFYTFPVSAPKNGEGGKKPLLKAWEEAATSDGSLFRHRPGANIGLALGRSGHLVLDVDRPEGEEAARELLGARPTMPGPTGPRPRHPPRQPTPPPAAARHGPSAPTTVPR